MHQNDNLPQSQWLKTTRIYSLEFLDVRLQNRSHWAKIRAFGKVVFPWKAYGRICFLAFFWFLEAAHISWLVTCLNPQSQKMTGQVFLMLHHFDIDSRLSLFYF